MIAAIVGALIAFIILMAFCTPSPLEYIGAAHEWHRAWRRHHRWTLLAIIALAFLAVI